MTHPLTPREKVRQIIEDALNSAIPEPWEAANHATDRVFTALASGSGDHAELADRLMNVSLHWKDADQEREEASRAITTLLAENAALRAEKDVLEVERIGLRSAIFGSHEYDPALRHGNFIEMARATEDARRGAVARATEAERKLAEAVGHGRRLLYLVDGGPSTGTVVHEWREAARTFLSKEAERG